MTSSRDVVAVGQVWADCDWRQEGRTIEVVEVDSTYAYCKVLTAPSVRISNLAHGRDTVGRPVRIRLDRMRPTSTGFRLDPRWGLRSDARVG